MSIDQNITACMLWFWLGFSLAFVLITYLHHIATHSEKAQDRGVKVLRSVSFITRVILTLILGIGLLGSAGLWPEFGREASWTALAFGVGILAAIWITVLLYGSPRAWANDVQSRTNESH